MLRKAATALLHLSMLALVCAIGTYWAIRIMTPAPASVPPQQPAAALREADPVLAARMFGLVQAAPVASQALNVQALGAFAAGPDSAAVLAVDGKPARVYLLNQEVSGGARLVEVRKDTVTIEHGGVRREFSLPPQQTIGLGGAPPPPGYTREGSTLTAPSVATAGQPAGAPTRPLPPRPAVGARPLPQQPIPPPQVQEAVPPQAEAVQPQQDQAEAEESGATPSGRARARPLAQ